MKIEMLSEEMWIENSKDFSKCEKFWIELDFDKAIELINAAYNISKVTETKTREFLKIDSALNLLKEGKVLRLPVIFIRELNEKPKCSNCGSSYENECIVCKSNNEIQDEFAIPKINYYIKNECLNDFNISLKNSKELKDSDYSDLGEWLKEKISIKLK